MTDAACILVADDDKAIRTVPNQALSRLDTSSNQPAQHQIYGSGLKRVSVTWLSLTS